MSIMNPLEMNYLVSLLEEVKKDVEFIGTYKGGTKTSPLYFFNPDEDKAVRSASEVATLFLFDDRGYVNREAKQDLMRNGYTVLFLEKDEEFGWQSLGI